MNTYDDVDAMWHDTIDQIMVHGSELDSRNGPSKELIGWAGKLSNIDSTFLSHPVRKLSASYAAAELIWYLSQETDIAGIVAYAPRYERFAEDGKAFGAYGWRWRNNPGFASRAETHGVPYRSQLEVAFELLARTPNTRQAIVAHWDSADCLHALAGDKKDLPCTLSLQFFARDGKLHMVTNMRSNDAWLGLPYDVFCFTGIQRIMADALGLGHGTYTHLVGSMHVYQEHYPKCEQVIVTGAIERLYATDGFYAPEDQNVAVQTICSKINLPVLQERHARLAGVPQEWLRMRSEKFITDLIYCAWHKTVPSFKSRELVRSAALKEGLR